MKTKKAIQAIDSALADSHATPKTAETFKSLRQYLARGENFCEPGTKVLNRDATHEGTTTGGTRPCTMEGCTGIRIAVRWPDGKITYPCSKGLGSKDGKYQII